jgi:hypothetical protein
MIPYILVLLFVVPIAYLGRVSNDGLLRRLSLGLVAFVLVAFAGLRDRTIGTDIGNYIFRFVRSESASSITRDTEIGYNFLSWLARGLSDSYAVLLTMIAIIVVGCYLSTMVRLVRRYETALFIFICLGVYTFFLNGARQGVAAAICFAALPFLLERRAIPYFLTVVVAALFHHSALIALPLYYLASSRMDLSRLLLIAAALVASIGFLQLFVQLAAQLLSDKYSAYAQQHEGGGEVFAAFLLCQGILFFTLKRKIRDPEGHYIRLLNIYLIGLVPVLASTVSSVNPSGLLRLHLYFSPVAILMWPMIFLRMGSSAERGFITTMFLGLMILFFVLTTATFSNLTPYRFNQELF